jgi:outer membrane protein assembly factor BamB
MIAYDRADGRVVWERVAREEAPHEPAHPQNGTWASGSAVTDGEHLFAYFGSRGLYCYTLDGEPVWERDFGQKRMRNHFGEGTTPVLHGDTIVVVWDHQGESFVFALDKRTGEERWRVPRDEIDSWATPVIVEHAGRHQVVIGAMDRVVSYDLDTGEIVW